MPELPEVETVARDLRPRILGATIVGARCLVGADPAHAHARGVRRGRRRPAGRGCLAARQADRHRPVRRRRADDPPQDDRPAVRRPGRDARGPVRAAGPRAGRRPRGSLPRHPQVREDRAVRTGPGDRRAGDRGRWWRGLRGARSGAARPRVLGARLPAPAAQEVGPAQAAPARPVVHRRGRQHLRRRGAVGRPAASAADGRDAATRRRAPPVRGGPADPGRGGRAPRQLDRRLHGARWRRLDAGAPAGLPADRRAVSALRAAGQADRHRRAIDPFLLVVPAARRRRPEGCCHDPADDDRRAAPVGRALDRAGRGGDRRADGRGSGSRVEPGTDRAHETGRRDATGRRPGVHARRRPRRTRPDEHPPPVGGDPRGRHVRHPRCRSTRRSRSATGSAWSARTAPARRRSCASPPVATSRTAARSIASAA